MHRFLTPIGAIRQAAFAMVLALGVCLMFLCLTGCGAGGSITNLARPKPTTPSLIAFTSSRALDGSDAANGAGNVWVMRSDGSGATPLTKLTTFFSNTFFEAWSPMGDKIVFRSARALDGSDTRNANGTENIWVMNADGSGAAPLTKITAAMGDSSSPVWSPDGRKIAFASLRALDGSDAANITRNIWVMNTDGSGVMPLTRLTAFNADSFVPVWSPDSSKLAFGSRRALNGADAVNTTFNIWVVNADGSNATPLTKLTAAESFDVAWSPDGGKLAFVSVRALDGSDTSNTTDNIWIMNADGSGAAPVTRLTAKLAFFETPRWSPDGNKLAFASSRALNGADAVNTSFNIWLVNADGSNATPLTKLTAADHFGAAWSPDGGMVTFSSGRALDGSDAQSTNGTFNIWAVNADGSGTAALTKLTAKLAHSDGAIWHP